MIKSCFKRLDPKDTGFIAKEQLRPICEVIGIHIAEADEHAAFGHYVDKNGDGKISFQEFYEFWEFMNQEHPYDLVNEDNLEWMGRCSQGFTYYDFNKNGSLQDNELEQFLPWLLNTTIGPADLATMQAEIKSHNIGDAAPATGVSFNSIVNWYLSKMQTAKNEALNNA